MNIKITELKLTVLERDVPGGKFAASDKAWGGRQKMLLVQLFTDQGIEGACFIGLHSSENSAWAIESISTVLRAELVGQNPLYRERIWHRMWLLRRRKRLSIFAIAALDAALWDIAGKLAGLPVYQLIGAARDRAPACASSSYFDDPNAYVDDTLRLKEKNYPMIKLFPGGTPKRDAAICTAVRKAAGADTKLAMDAVFSYGRVEALQVGRVIQDLGFEWFEEPLQETDIQGYVELSRALDIPVAAGDTEVVNLASLPEYLLRGAVDIIRCDVAWKGGITPAKRIADICDAFGVRCEFHHAGNALLNAANLHVILSMKGESYCEIMMPPELQEYGLTEYVRADRDGYVNAPTKPGLGYDIDRERIKRDTVAEV